jgi:hypothetical protein
MTIPITKVTGFNDSRLFKGACLLQAYNDRLEDLVKKFSEAQTSGCPAPIIELKALYAGKLPDAMFEIWDRIGFGVFFDGYFQLCDPRRYHSVLEAVFTGDPDISAQETHVFGFSAFGELFAWNETHGAINVDLVNGWVLSDRLSEPETERDQNMSLVARVLISNYPDTDVFDTNGKGMFSRVLKRLGPLPYGSIYGFRPILALGGPRDPARLSVYEALAHMTLLSQATQFKLMDTSSIEPRVLRMIGQ